MNFRLFAAFGAVLICGMLLGALVYSQTVAKQVQIQNKGAIRSIGVEVYADVGLTQIRDSIAWGTLEPGDSVSVTVYVKNTGSDVQRLVIWAESWVPSSAQNSLTLSWDYVDSWISSGDSIPVKFTLTVDPEVEGVSGFGFVIWVQGVA